MYRKDSKGSSSPVSPADSVKKEGGFLPFRNERDRLGNLLGVGVPNLRRKGSRKLMSLLLRDK